MYFWRCVIAGVLSVLWCLTDSGQVLIQAGVCFLCFHVVFPPGSDRSENSTQTDGTAEETQSEENDHRFGRDELDTAAPAQTKINKMLYPNVLKSLHQLFKSAYAQLVLPWYMAPEIKEKQPLYTALLEEYNLIVDQIICKARNFDLSLTSVGCVHIFTQHLRCAKQSDRSLLSNNEAQEMDVLRRFSDALIRNLVSRHLWEQKVYQCALQEILATKALAVVTMLSDPDILNRLLVCLLDRGPSESQLEERCDSDREDSSSFMGVENKEVFKEKAKENVSEDIKSKKKGSKMKKTITKLFKTKGDRKKKMEKKEKELMQRVSLLRRPAVIETDGASSCEDSNYDSEDSDVGSYTCSLQEDMMEFKLSFQMWLAGKWTVTVPDVEMEAETLCFTVHVEESGNPENLHWDVKKTQSEMEDFHKLCKDFPHLPSISPMIQHSEKEFNEDFKKGTIMTFEHLLQALVADAELGHSQHVFKFLCPLHRLLRDEEKDGGFWVLLGGLASFLQPGQEDDEPCHLKVEKKPDEHLDKCSVSEATHDELASAQPLCLDTLQRQYKDTEKDLLATDSEYSASSDQTNDVTRDIVFSDCPFGDADQAFSSGSGGESVGENLAQFAARTKVIPKKQPAVFSSFDSDSESIGHYETDGFSDCHSNENVNMKEHLACKKSSSSDKPKGKEKGCQIKEETQSLPQIQKKMVNQSSCGQHDVNTVMFDLLKEISGNSRILKIIKTGLKPFMPLVKKKVNTFLKKMNPSEVEIAKRIDQIRELLWPDDVVSQEPSRSGEDKNETKEKAMHLISSKLASYPILSKTDVETMFKILQDAEENKKLVYDLLRYILREFLPGEVAFKGASKLYSKDIYCQ